MQRASLRLFAFLALALALTACHRNPSSSAPSNATPENALRTDLALTREGDFDGLLRSELPPADYQAWRAEWQRARAQQPAPTPEQRAHFAEAMQKLTAPGAEDALFRQLQPQLAQLHAHRAQNLPMLIGILQATGSDWAQNAGLSPNQKQQATQALAALAAWAQGADFSDEAKAKQAIGMICATARKLDVQTLDQWRALDYGQVMARYTMGWTGLKELLKIYGLDLDAAFDNAKFETLSDDGANARMRETLMLAGKPIVSEANLTMQDGHWYDADQLAAWRKQHSKPVVAATVASAASAASDPPAKASSAPAH